MTGALYAVGRSCGRWWFVVLAVWLIATVALVAVSHRLGENTNDNLSLPGMVFVFGSFVLNGDPTVKQFGVGLAVAVILDATVVRCLLVPALMTLMGRLNWYMPGWLDGLVPHVSIEGGEYFKRRDRSAPPERDPALAR